MKGVHTKHPHLLTACVLVLALSLALLGGCSAKNPTPDKTDGSEVSAPQDVPDESAKGQGSDTPSTAPDDVGAASDADPSMGPHDAPDDSSTNGPTEDADNSQDAENEGDAGGGETAPDAGTSDTDSDKDSIMAAYQPVLDAYRTILAEHWDAETIEEAGMNRLLAYHNDPSEIGYVFKDINNDGTDELLVGELVDCNVVEGSVMDIYTLTNNTPAVIASGGERILYTLCKSGILKCELSDGAANSNTCFYAVNPDGTFTLVEAVVFNGMIDSENPWFSTTTPEDTTSYTPISEDDAAQIMGKYTAVTIEYQHLDAGLADE